VPVMGHVGLTPQAINTLGSFRAQGRDEVDWAPIEADARAVAEAGAFSVVLEAMAEPLARRITGEVAIPTIGIGASVACDGQILVLEDMLVAAGAAIRQTLWRSRTVYRIGGKKLRRGCARSAFPQPGPRLPNAESQGLAGFPDGGQLEARQGG